MMGVKLEQSEQLKKGVSLFRQLVAEYDKRVQSSMLEFERLEVIFALNRMEHILSKYEDRKQRKEGEWTFYKKIPSRYWHEMHRAYHLFMDLPETKMGLFSKDERIKMYLFIRLLPALSKFDKVMKAGGLKFNVFQRVYYDYLCRE